MEREGQKMVPCFLIVRTFSLLSLFCREEGGGGRSVFERRREKRMTLTSKKTGSLKRAGAGCWGLEV